MPAKNYIALRALKDAVEDADASGHPHAALDAQLTLWRSAGTNTLIHSSSRKCLYSARRLKDPQEWHGSLRDALTERMLCDCARTNAKLGAGGAWLSGHSRLVKCERLVVSLETYPADVRYNVIVRARQELRGAEQAVNSGAVELIERIDALNARIDNFLATHEPAWREALNTQRGWLWWHAQHIASRHDRGTDDYSKFVTHIADGGCVEQFTPGSVEFDVNVAMNELCGTKQVTYRTWLIPRVGLGAALYVALEQLDCVKLESASGNGVVGNFPQVVASTLLDTRPGTGGHQMFNPVLNAAALRLFAETWEPLMSRTQTTELAETAATICEDAPQYA